MKPLSPAEILRRLTAIYGEPEWRPHHDSTGELVLTLLSQNTSDTNSGRAFSRLLQRFPDWDAALEAPLPEIEDAIRPGGLAPTKAPRLKAMLTEIKARTGALDLEFLRVMPDAEAREWLRTLPAVGPKTAACVLLFALGKPALPVDTHVYRVAVRLGLVAQKLTPEKAQDVLEAKVPARDQYLFHVMLIRHGRHTCYARNPACERCPLLDGCPFGRDVIAGRAKSKVAAKRGAGRSAAVASAAGGPQRGRPA